MAHKKGASSSRNGRDSHAQRLGVKRFGGQQVKARARSSRASAVPTSTRAPASAAARMSTLFAHVSGAVTFGAECATARAVSVVAEAPAAAGAPVAD